MPMLWLLPGPTAGTRRNPAAPPKLREDTTHALVCGLKVADAGITTEPRGLTATQSRPADIFTTAAVPGCSAALDVCGLSPMQQQLEDTRRRHHLIATDVASSRCGQLMSAKSLERRWKHEVQIALLSQRAAMTRAVLTNPSAH